MKSTYKWHLTKSYYADDINHFLRFHISELFPEKGHLPILSLHIQDIIKIENPNKLIVKVCTQFFDKSYFVEPVELDYEKHSMTLLKQIDQIKKEMQERKPAPKQLSLFENQDELNEIEIDEIDNEY